jgi:hypothetical protein
MAFLKELLTSATEPLSLDELNEVKKIVTVLCNTKIKAQQNVTKKKKGSLPTPFLSIRLMGSFRFYCACFDGIPY